MTFDEMLEYPERLEALSDAQLVALLAPYFPITRPANLSVMAAVADDSDMDPALATKLAELRAKAAEAKANNPLSKLFKKPV